MEYRKLIKFGNSSHVITIPNSWIKKNKLKKGAIIYFEENNNGELVITPRLVNNINDQKEIIIEFDKKKSLEDIEREVLSAYINNFSLIKIKGENLKKYYKDVKDILRNFVAMEVIEQNSSLIIAKDFLNMGEISVTDIIRKMDILTRSMIEDSIKCMEENLYDEIYDRDLHVNRLCFLILRVIKKSMENPSLAKSLSLDGKNILPTWRLVNNIEEISDESKRIARYIVRAKLKGEKKEVLKRIYISIKNVYLESIKSYYDSNNKLAFEIASKINNIIKECDNYFMGNRDPIISKLTERMKIMLNHIKYIPRSVFE